MMYGQIYKVTNLLNGFSYIGQTTQNVKMRWKQHCRAALASKCARGVLHQSIRKNGHKNFVIEIIGVAFTKAELDALEIYFISGFNTREPHGYNRVSGGSHGRHNERTRLKISAAHKGRKCLQHVIESNRLRMLGATVSRETRAKISASLRGRPLTAETKAKMSLARTGKKRTDAHRMSEYLSGVPKSARGRENIRLSALGRKASLETRLKMSESQRLIWSKRRNAGNNVHPPVVLSETA